MINKNSYVDFLQMACSLNTVATVDDLTRIRAALLPHLLNTLSDNDQPTTDTDATEDDEGSSKIILLPFQSIIFINVIFLSRRKCCSNSSPVNRTWKKEEKIIRGTSTMAS